MTRDQIIKTEVDKTFLSQFRLNLRPYTEKQRENEILNSCSQSERSVCT